MSDQLDRDAAGALIVGFTGTTAPDELRRVVAAGLGAVILFTRNYADSEQLTRLVADIHAVPDVSIGRPAVGPSVHATAQERDLIAEPFERHRLDLA